MVRQSRTGQWATDAAAWGGRIIVRYAHEMNGPWFPWSMGKVGNTSENFQAAWRHAVTLVRAIAPDVRFLWGPDAPCGDSCTARADLYPGDVDLVGFDTYIWRTGFQRPMVKLYQEAMDVLRALTSLPVIVAETAAAGPAGSRRVDPPGLPGRP